MGKSGEGVDGNIGWSQRNETYHSNNRAKFSDSQHSTVCQPDPLSV